MKSFNYMNLMGKWKKYFNKSCIHNDPVAELIFHQLVGACLEAKFNYSGEPINTRINSGVIQPSGTGKGQGVKPAEILCDKMGFAVLSNKRFLVNLAILFPSFFPNANFSIFKIEFKSESILSRILSIINH
jgi:hypothetical protein